MSPVCIHWAAGEGHETMLDEGQELTYVVDRLSYEVERWPIFTTGGALIAVNPAQVQSVTVKPWPDAQPL